MRILITDARVIDPASGLDAVGDVCIAAGRIQALPNQKLDGFVPEKTIVAKGCWVIPGLVDLSARLGEPGGEHAQLLQSELAAAGAGGVTSLVCPPDTTPVLDEPGLVEMLKFRAAKLHGARVFPLGALTRGLRGENLTAMVELSGAGCVGFSQAETPIVNTQVLQRALQYAATHGYTTWLRPQDAWLGAGIAASGAYATRLGLSGVSIAAETVALHTIFDLVRATGAAIHIQRISSAQGAALLKSAKAEGLPITADVSINSLFLVDTDIGYFDSRMRVLPPLRQARDRDALRAALQDGTIDALVSDHTPVSDDGKTLPFGEAQVGATGLELLLNLTLRWADESKITVSKALERVCTRPAAVLGKDMVGHLTVGGQADLCVFDPKVIWTANPKALLSQGKHTPFSHFEFTGKVRTTIANGHISYQSTS